MEQDTNQIKFFTLILILLIILHPHYSVQSHNSFKSGSSNYEVEISTGHECPSERTVFVKCGHFECGQDTFGVMDQILNESINVSGNVNSVNSINPNGRRLGTSNHPRASQPTVQDDFPWLVSIVL